MGGLRTSLFVFVLNSALLDLRGLVPPSQFTELYCLVQKNTACPREQADQKYFKASIMTDFDRPALCDRQRYVVLDENTLNHLIDAKLTAAQYRAFLYFSLVDPFGNRPVDTSGPMARQRLGISKSTYYEALSKLQAEGFFDFEDVVMRVRNKVGAKAPEKNTEEKIVRKIEPDSEFSNTSPENQTPVRKIEPDSENSESQPLESMTSNSSEVPQYSSIESIPLQDIQKKRENTKANSSKTNQTKKDILHSGQPVKGSQIPPDQKRNSSGWNNFSAPGDDTEFFKFVLKRVAKLPQPPADALCVAESWIQKQGHLLYSQYVSWSEERQRVDAARRSPLTTVPEPPPLAPEPEPSSDDRLAKYRALWQVDGLHPHIRKTLKAHPEWGLEIGADGPRLVTTDAEESITEELSA